MASNEFILNYTGEELDEAIEKFKTNYMEIPNKTLNVTQNILSPKNILEYSDLTVNVQQEQAVFYNGLVVTPSSQQQIFNPTTYGADGFGQFTVDKISDDYINKINIGLHLLKNTDGSYVKYNSGTFQGSGQRLSEVQIDVTFKPKIFIMSNADSVFSNSTAVPYIINGAVLVCDDNYNIIERRGYFILRGDSSNGQARGGQSNNSFAPTENGVIGSNSSLAVANKRYNWWAWG